MEGTYPNRSHGSGRSYAEFTFTAPGSGTSVAVANIDGSDVVASITHVGGTNVLAVTLSKRFNKIVAAEASVIATDGKRATIGSIANEGHASNAPTFNIYTWVAAGTANNDNADRITVRLALRSGYQGVK